MDKEGGQQVQKDYAKVRFTVGRRCFATNHLTTSYRKE